MKNPLPSLQRRKAGGFLTTSVGIAALVMSACAVSNAQTTELDGAPDGEVLIESQVRIIFIDEDEIETQTFEDAEGTQLRIITRLDGGDLPDDGVLRFTAIPGADDELAGRSLVVVGGGANPEARENARKVSELASEFAQEMRLLSQSGGDNRAEMEALRTEFEAQVESLSMNMIGGANNVRVMRFDEDVSWPDDGGEDCGSGEQQTRTVIVDGDGEGEDRIMTVCAKGGPVIDSAQIMQQLRTEDRLSEARLAEIEVKLAEAAEKLDGLNLTSEFDLDIDIDIDEDETDIDIEIEDD